MADEPCIDTENPTYAPGLWAANMRDLRDCLNMLREVDDQIYKILEDTGVPQLRERRTQILDLIRERLTKIGQAERTMGHYEPGVAEL
jgi:hypothetical protein